MPVELMDFITDLYDFIDTDEEEEEEEEEEEAVASNKNGV